MPLVLSIAARAICLFGVISLISAPAAAAPPPNPLETMRTAVAALTKQRGTKDYYPTGGHECLQRLSKVAGYLAKFTTVEKATMADLAIQSGCPAVMFEYAAKLPAPEQHAAYRVVCETGLKPACERAFETCPRGASYCLLLKDLACQDKAKLCDQTFSKTQAKELEARCNKGELRACAYRTKSLTDNSKDGGRCSQGLVTGCVALLQRMGPVPGDKTPASGQDLVKFKKSAKTEDRNNLDAGCAFLGGKSCRAAALAGDRSAVALLFGCHTGDKASCEILAMLYPNSTKK